MEPRQILVYLICPEEIATPHIVICPYQTTHIIIYLIVEKKYDNTFSLSSDPHMYPFPVLTISLRGGKNNTSTIVARLTRQWGSGATKSTINRIHTKTYECIIQYKKVAYITAAGPYCTTHNVKVSFFMTEFSSSKIILHHFYVDNNEGE